MKIWAHRGCSQRYPENTLLAFEKAIEINGLEGIELDIQLTKDGKIVVIHDERIDRTTEGIGFVKDYTLSELKRFHIYADTNPSQSIPTIDEVFDLISDRMKKGLKLNIELKNSNFPYEGMEEKILDLAYKRGLQDNIVYSSFYAWSVEKIKQLDKNAKTGILDVKISDCLYKLKGGCGADALHPFWRGIDISDRQFSGQTVRAWFSGHLYPEKSTGTVLNLKVLEGQGITDVFLNEPEVYFNN